MEKRTILRIEVIPHSEQRYDTIGDWMYTDEGELVIRVSELIDTFAEVLVGLHEAVEATAMSHVNGQALENSTLQYFDRVVCAFDKDFEAQRKMTLIGSGDFMCTAGHTHGIDDEPGDCAAAPYRNAHSLATALERMLCAFVGYPWQRYETACLTPVKEK